MDSEIRPWPGQVEIRELLGHLPTLERPAAELYEHRVPATPGLSGFVDYTPVFGEFINALRRLGFVQETRYPMGREVEQQLERLDDADLTDCVRLLTAFVRAERFGDGAWAAATGRGWFRLVLLRLAAIDTTVSAGQDRTPSLLANRLD